jgi:hypothetical protein
LHVQFGHDGFVSANVAEAHQAMASASEYSAQVFHKLLLDHPCTLTPECKLDIVAHNKDKFPNLVARIADGEGQDKDTAISQLADQNKTVTAALAQIQLVVNHQIIRMIGKLLTPAKRNGLMPVLPKLKLAFTTHCAQQALKPKEERAPHSAKSAIKLLDFWKRNTLVAQPRNNRRLNAICFYILAPLKCKFWIGSCHFACSFQHCVLQGHKSR